jgi:hypothetical protein
MSKIALSGNASGTGTFTIASPNSNSDRTLNLPDAAGTIQVSGNPISGTTGTFTGLVDISAAGAGQIAFPATQNASANANTLDDYEEGTFTPTATFSTSNVGVTFTNRSGLYTKVGRLVTVQINVFFSALGSASGDFEIGGLPFASFNDSYLARFAGACFLDRMTNAFCFGNGANSTVLSLETIPNGSGSAARLTQANFNNTSFISLTFSYVTNN